MSISSLQKMKMYIPSTFLSTYLSFLPIRKVEAETEKSKGEVKPEHISSTPYRTKPVTLPRIKLRTFGIKKGYKSILINVWP